MKSETKVGNLKILAQTCRVLKMSRTEAKGLRNLARTNRAWRALPTETRNLGTRGSDLKDKLEKGPAGELEDAAEVGAAPAPATARGQHDNSL